MTETTPKKVETVKQSNYRTKCALLWLLFLGIRFILSYIKVVEIFIARSSLFLRLFASALKKKFFPFFEILSPNKRKFLRMDRFRLSRATDLIPLDLAPNRIEKPLSFVSPFRLSSSTFSPGGRKKEADMDDERRKYNPRWKKEKTTTFGWWWN